MQSGIDLMRAALQRQKAVGAWSFSDNNPEVHEQLAQVAAFQAQPLWKKQSANGFVPEANPENYRHPLLRERIDQLAEAGALIARQIDILLTCSGKEIAGETGVSLFSEQQVYLKNGCPNHIQINADEKRFIRIEVNHDRSHTRIVTNPDQFQNITLTTGK